MIPPFVTIYLQKAEMDPINVPKILAPQRLVVIMQVNMIINKNRDVDLFVVMIQINTIS